MSTILPKIPDPKSPSFPLYKTDHVPYLLLDTVGQRPLNELTGSVNPNIEARNTKQIRISNDLNSKQTTFSNLFWSFVNLNFDIVSSFGFRISNFSVP